MNVCPLLAVFARCFSTMENLRRWIVFGVESKVTHAPVHAFIQEIKFFIPPVNNSRTRNKSIVGMSDLHIGTICHKV